MQFPIHIELRRSRLLRLLTFLVHGLAAACVLFLPWPPPARALLLAMIAFSAWHSRRRSRVIALHLLASGEVVCLLASGEQVSALVQPDTAVFSQLVVLRVRAGETDRIDSLALLPDSMSAAQFRLLRLWLRWRVEPKGHGVSGHPS